MLKIYNVTDYISIDGANWRVVGNRGYMATDEEPKNTLILDNVSFSEAYKYLSLIHLDGVHNDCTFFRNKPLIQVYYYDAWDYVQYRRFNTMSYKREYSERKNISLNWIMEHLAADDCIQYLKDRGITTCPVLK